MTEVSRRIEELVKFWGRQRHGLSMDKPWDAVSALALASLAVTAAVTARKALGSLYLGRAAQVHESRPLLHPHLEMSERGRGALDLVVTNLGRSAALDVEISFPGETREIWAGKLTPVLIEGGFDLAPGQSHRIPWTGGSGGKTVSTVYEGAGLMYRGSHVLRYQEAGPVQETTLGTEPVAGTTGRGEQTPGRSPGQQEGLTV